jgi:sulfite reductase alpha subunit-like flavoprotein
MLLMTPYEYNVSLRVRLHLAISKPHHLPIVSDQSLPDRLPRVSTLRMIFSRHLDINAVPRRSFFRLLEHFATDEREREKLEEFSSSEGAVRVSLHSDRHQLIEDRKSYTSIRPEFAAQSVRF